MVYEDRETCNQLNKYELRMKLDVTTTNITAERASTLIDQFTFKDPEFIHVAIIALCSYPDETTLQNDEQR